MLKKIVLIMLLITLSISLTAVAQDETAPWDSWAAVDVSAIDDDNSGSVTTLSDSLTSPNGMPAWQVLPSGTSDETKLAVSFAGTDLEAWASASQLMLDVYLPETNALNPNSFFLGLADMTDGFAWMGGVFGQADAAPGWNRVVFTLDASMRNFMPEREYTLFLSFFHSDANGAKIPLTEIFYVGGASVVGSSLADCDESTAWGQEADALLALDDAALIDAVARATFDYFWLEANPDNGLIRDRSTPDSPSSIAATGFGLAAIPIGVERGWISADEGYARALTTLQSFADGRVQGENGFYYHFVDMQTGRRVWQSELSSIDTALLLAGALAAGEYFADTDVQLLAEELYAAVDWEWMRDGREFVAMGWTPENGFLNAAWDHFDESLILYVLAIGSPTHPLPADIWDDWLRPVNLRGEYVYLTGEPLFVYQYPLAFLGLRDREDAFVNYWNNAARACVRNRQFSTNIADRYSTYRDGAWGISASDGPRGYRAYGAAPGNHDGTIAPHASASCLPLAPDIALEGMRALLREYGARVWREYGFVSAINAEADWYSTDFIGIDQGDILLMLANAQDGLVWRLLAGNAHISRALDAMGFVESTGDYAVTPGFMARLRGG
ncbi:MAG: hypothetical protein KME04_14765 [Pleurocapsa minor GSE-CHR-MK-17-07R]|jgi:hypothetical protein|nr:hypothetical protein [Pleurocapsa minor GSE-CHR-MK 17-07R]